MKSHKTTHHIDNTPLDLVVLGAGGEAWRPTITIIMDAVTRTIVGMHVGAPTMPTGK